jgi:RNA-dependent RNA polymerase
LGVSVPVDYSKTSFRPSIFHMELDLLHIHREANRWDVTRAIANILHNDPGPDWFGIGGTATHPRPLHFRVAVNDGHGGLRNNGTGVLTLPSWDVGRKLLIWRDRGGQIRVLGKAIKVIATQRKPTADVQMTLEKAPFVDPDKEERLQQILTALEPVLEIDEVQFGILCPPKGPKPGPRFFSIEFREDYTERHRPTLKFEWKYRQIRLTVCIPLTRLH